MLPITRYQAGMIKFYSIIGIVLFLSVFIFGNIITYIVRDNVIFDEKYYELKNGYPLILSQKNYISLIKKYPYNPGVKLTIHRTRQNQSLWDISGRYNVSIDTLISANPFLKTLVLTSNSEIVVPVKDGVLFAFDDFSDVSSMKKLLKFKGEVKGDYFPTFFKIFSSDDIRFVFFKNATPEIVNDNISKLYNIRKIFQNPVKHGRYTSLYGNRIDPFLHVQAFHKGVDIQARYGTPVYPARRGMVIFSGWRQGYGKTVMIQHYDGYTTLYSHYSSLKVKKGDWVEKDRVIGLIGSTGRSTGPHLHFSVYRHGFDVNPILLIW